MSEEEFNKLLRRINYYLELQETDNLIYDAYDIFGDDAEVYQYMRYTTNLEQENKQLKEELNEYKFPSCKTKDIEIVRANLTDMITKNKRLEQENEQLKEDKKKARDKLYCYGEVFDGKILQQFQKEMLEILGDKE